MLMLLLVNVLLVHVQHTVSNFLPWPLQSDTGCYGNTAGDFVNPLCNLTSPSVMVVSRVYGMAKTLSTGCPHTATVADRDEEKCCTFAEEDCKMNYTSDAVFYRTCTGQPGCDMNVAWMPTTCNHSEYLPRSNYMLMEYYCIETSLILNATDTEDSSTTGRAVYIQSEEYPGSSVLGGSCSVSSSCKTSVTITVIHLNLNDAGTCSQFIHISDGDTNHTINCTRNNDDDYVIEDVYHSESHFLVLSFINENVADEGQMWIQIMGNNKNSTMDLRCGSQAVSVPPDVDKCPDPPDESTPSPASTPTGQSTTVTQDNPDVTKDLPSTGQTEEGGLTGIIAGVIVAVVLSAGLIISIIYWRKKKHKGNNKVGDKERLDEYGEDGLPVYQYGTKPEIITSHKPNQTLLHPSQGSDTGEEKPKQPRIMSALKTFDKVQRTPSSLAGPLPQVRGPPRPTSRDLVNNLGVAPVVPMVNQDEMGTGLQANGNAVLGGEESHSKSQKKKKKHKKSESGNDEHGQKKKKKKKKAKQKDEEK